MNGSKLLVIGVLVGFGGGMTAAIGMKLVRSRGKSANPVVEAGGTGAPGTPAGDASAELGGPTITPFDLSPTPAPAAAGAPADDLPRSGSAEAPRPASTKRIAMIPKGTPRSGNVIDEMPVEGPPASMVFGKGGGGNAILKIIEERHNDTSLLRVELSGKARYKILQLPKRHELWIDFEETEVPGGEKTASGSNVHVEEVRARTFSQPNAIARVTVRLANEGKFSVFPSKGTGEADGMLEIMLGP